MQTVGRLATLAAGIPDRLGVRAGHDRGVTTPEPPSLEPPLLETGRLLLRPIGWDDLAFFVAVHADPQVARTIGNGTPRSAQETRDLLERILDSYSQGVGHLAVVRRADGELIGRAGLTVYEVERSPADGGTPRAWWGAGAAPEGVDVRGELEVGYTLTRSAWGRGYATEAARAVRDHALEDRDAPFVMSLIYPQNGASIRVAEKNGMRPAGEVDSWGNRLRRFEVDRASWAAREL